MPIGLCHELAIQWYPGRDEKEWQRPAAKETQKLFSTLGLVGDFWRLE